MKTDFWFCILLSVVMLICSVTICSAMHVWLFHKSCCDDFWKMYQAFSMFDVTDVHLCWNLDDPMLRCLWFQVLCAWKRAYLRCFAAPIIRQHPISKKGQYHWLLEPSVLCATTHRECSRCQLDMTFRTVVAFQLQCRMGYPLLRSDVSIATINNNGGK